MKVNNKLRKLLPIVPFIGLLVLCGYWIVKTNKEFTIYTYLLFLLLFLVFTFSLYFKIVDYKNALKGLNIDDEFSKLVKEKSGNRAFQLSIYMWLFIICFIDIETKSKIIICFGMIGMGFLYFLMQFYLSKRGI